MMDAPDILVTNLAQEKWALYRNEGAGQFSYATAASGLAALGRQKLRMGCRPRRLRQRWI